MDRHLHKKYQPQCPRNAAIVDQYSWGDKDTTKYKCYNGISHPIYDCKGWVNYSLPLEMYPPVNEVHPQIAMVKREHMNYRESPYVQYRESYGRPYVHLQTDMVPGYSLPSPYGDTRYTRRCNIL